jgi:hypothetical protein
MVIRRAAESLTIEKQYPPGAAPSSEWPASLLLDELWLRTRRVLVRRLEAEKLWPTNGEIEDHRARRANLGQHLRNTVLTRLLNPAEHRYLESDAAFGPGADRLNAKIGRCLAFGHEIGVVLDKLATGADPQCRIVPDEARAAELCAIFNLGIGIFDLVHDESSEMADDFATLFDAEVLHKALADPAVAAGLSTASQALPAPELRLLGRLVAAYLTGLHAEVSTAQALEPIGTVLSAAYTAEKASMVGASGDAALRISRTKSTLPFHVLLETVALIRGRTTVSTLRSAVDAMGTVFWLVDDLVDLVVDFQSGALNSILAKASLTISYEAHDGKPDELAAEYELLENILDGHHVESTVEQVVCALRGMSDSFLVHGCDPSTVAAATLIVRDYVRFWVE